MEVIIYSFNLNISPKMPNGVHECDIVMLQNCMPMILQQNIFNTKWEGALFVPNPVYVMKNTH